jgi:hypothetical protein
LYAAWWLYRQGELEFRDVRIYLALEEMQARRCTLKEGRTPCYTLAELERLSGAGNIRSIRASLRRLQRAGLSTWNTASIEFPEEHLVGTRIEFAESLWRIENHRRRVPVPRRTLRLLISSTRPALVATVFGHLLRCVYLRGRALSAEGSVSAAWISSIFSVDRRNVKRAKVTLRELNWLTEKPTRHWHRQRYGQTVAVNLDWGKGIEGRMAGRTCLPPRSAPIRTCLPPPDSDRELPKEVKNQKRQRASGVREQGSRLDKPRPWNVAPADLAEPFRIAELFGEAARCGLVKDSQMDRLQFFAAAHRAVRFGRNPGGFFTAIVKRGLWAHVSTSEEEWARTQLAKMPEFLYGSVAHCRERSHTDRAHGARSRDTTEDGVTIRELVRNSLATARLAL